MHKDDLMKFLESFAKGARENAVPEALLTSVTEFVQKQIECENVLSTRDVVLAWGSFDRGFKAGWNR